jgi:hypothetical protein
VLYRPAHNRMAPALEHPWPGSGHWRQGTTDSEGGGSGGTGAFQTAGLGSEQQQQWQVASGEGMPGERQERNDASASAATAVGGGRWRRRRRGVKRGLGSGWLRRLWARWRGLEEDPAVKRPPIQIRMYRDIPVRHGGTWQGRTPEAGFVLEESRRPSPSHVVFWLRRVS